MRNFLRLLRYGLPYTLQWVPGVLLLAGVGLLDNFRLLLFVPIFDDVGSIQQHGLGKPRQRASTPVSSDHRFTEGRLMKTLLDGP